MNDLLPKTVRLFWAKVSKTSTCWLWTASRTSAGYGKFKVDRQPHPAHRVAWRIARGPIPNGLFVLHRCDTPLCVRPAHLFLGTPKDNTQDMMRKGRHRCGGGGAANTQAKLTWEKVHEIRSRYDATRHLLLRTTGRVRAFDLAAEFGVSTTSIHAILNNESWIEND